MKVPPSHEWDDNGKCKWCPATRPIPHDEQIALLAAQLAEAQQRIVEYRHHAGEQGAAIVGLRAQLAEAQQQVTDNFNAGCSIARKLVEAQQEDARLTAEVFRMGIEIAEAQRERDGLKRLLFKYGTHATGCPVPRYGSDRECSCGWLEIDKPGGIDAALERT